MKVKEKIIIVVISSISVVIVGLTWYAYWKIDFLNLTCFLETYKLGDFGDFIGGFLGTILTGIATFLVYRTYVTQKKELKVQRKLIAQQQFENTFFNMLNVHRELKKNLSYKEISISDDLIQNGKLYDGLSTINYINTMYTKNYKDLKHRNHSLPGTLQNSKLIQLEKDLSKYNEINEENILIVCFTDLFKNHQNQISHYCRNVYHILKYIRENEKNKTLGKDQKKYKNYASIFQSQLNVDEQFLLFYNFIHFNEKRKGIYSTINLVNHYTFLENIGIDNLLFKKHEEFYDFVIEGSDRIIVK
ncbi:Putative phage abortive infection protein [Flavobacteriaceae bacterium]